MPPGSMSRPHLVSVPYVSSSTFVNHLYMHVSSFNPACLSACVRVYVCVCVCLSCFSSYSLFCEFFCRGIFIQISKLYLIHVCCVCLSFNQKACWSLRWIDVLITQALESPRFSHISVTLRFSHRAKLRGTMPPGIMSSSGPPRRPAASLC